MGDPGRPDHSPLLARARWWLAGLTTLLVIAGGAFVFNSWETSSPDLDRAEQALEAVRSDIRAAVAEDQGEICAEAVVSGSDGLAWEREGVRIRITKHYPIDDFEQLVDQRLAEFQVPPEVVVRDEGSSDFFHATCDFISDG